MQRWLSDLQLFHGLHGLHGRIGSYGLYGHDITPPLSITSITSIKSIEFFKCLFFNSSLVVFSRKEQAPGVV